MAIIKSSEAREMTPDQIEEKIKELNTEVSKMRSQVRSGGAPENGGKLREIKRTIARLKTIKSQKVKKA